MRFSINQNVEISACFHYSSLWLQLFFICLQRKMQCRIPKSGDSLLFNVKAFSPKSDWSSKACFLKKSLFHSRLDFWLSFPPTMSQAAYDSSRGECKSIAKISRSRHSHYLGHVTDVNFIDQILIFVDISNIFQFNNMTIQLYL